MIKGNDLIVYADGVAVGAAKSCELQIVGDVLDCAGVDGWRRYVGGRKSWSMSVGRLLTDLDVVKMVGRRVRVTFGARMSGSLTADRLSGEAIVTGVRVVGSRMSLSVCTLTLQGCGSLERRSHYLLTKSGLALRGGSSRLKVLAEP